MNIAQALKNFVTRKLTKDNIRAIEAEQERIVVVTEYLQSEISEANAAIEKHRKAELNAIASAAAALAERSGRLMDHVSGKTFAKVSDAQDALWLAETTAREAV